MTHIKRSTVAALVTLVIAGGACNTDKLTNLNNNPNNPADVPASTLFTAGSVRGVNLWLGAGYDLRGTEFVTQHLAEVQYPDEDRYARLTGGSTQIPVILARLRALFPDARFVDTDAFGSVGLGLALDARRKFS